MFAAQMSAPAVQQIPPSKCRSDGTPALKGADQGDFVGIFEVAADGQSPRNSRDASHDRLQALRQVHSGGLTFQGWVGGDDHFLERLPLVLGLLGPLEKLADLVLVRTHAVDRRDGAVEYVI